MYTKSTPFLKLMLTDLPRLEADTEFDFRTIVANKRTIILFYTVSHNTLTKLITSYLKLVKHSSHAAVKRHNANILLTLSLV